MRLYASTVRNRPGGPPVRGRYSISLWLCAAVSVLLTTGSALAAQIAAPEAVEPMAGPGSSGVDYSTNAPSLSSLSLLATIPAPSTARRGYFVEAQCTAGLTVVLDDAAGATQPTIVVLAGSAANGGQGGSIDMNGMPHTGRIRIYSAAANCQMAARAW